MRQYSHAAGVLALFKQNEEKTKKPACTGFFELGRYTP
jgi:hypothetical protein